MYIGAHNRINDERIEPPCLFYYMHFVLIMIIFYFIFNASLSSLSHSGLPEPSKFP